MDGGNVQHYAIRYPSYDGQGSFYAQITEKGLLSKWQVMDLDSTTISSYRDDSLYQMVDLLASSEDMQELNPDLDVDTPIYAHPDEACAYKLMVSLLSNSANVRVLRPLAEDGTSSYEGGSNRGGPFGLIAAICASFDEGKTWEWKGVYQWPESNTDIRWKVEEMLII
jgi:hypothetical protein